MNEDGSDLKKVLIARLAATSAGVLALALAGAGWMLRCTGDTRISGRCYSGIEVLDFGAVVVTWFLAAGVVTYFTLTSPKWISSATVWIAWWRELKRLKAQEARERQRLKVQDGRKRERLMIQFERQRLLIQEERERQERETQERERQQPKSQTSDATAWELLPAEEKTEVAPYPTTPQTWALSRELRDVISRHMTEASFAQVEIVCRLKRDPKERLFVALRHYWRINTA